MTPTAWSATANCSIDRGKEYSASSIITAAMKVFARDSRVVSIDADLASTSGLEAGVAAVDQTRALNVGAAEANMMNIGEAYAAMGYNAWVSTFCPFFDWKVLRRIAVGYQERLETIPLEHPVAEARLHPDEPVAGRQHPRPGRPLFIHSGTYEQLLEVFGLAPAQLAETIARKVGS